VLLVFLFGKKNNVKMLIPLDATLCSRALLSTHPKRLFGETRERESGKYPGNLLHVKADLKLI
jgi:hypothetical protein